MYFVDGCHEWNHPNITQIPYKQKEPPTTKSKNFTHLERDSIRAALSYMSASCKFVVKLTGKYKLPSLFATMDAMPADASLIVQSRGKCCGGWSCELFGMERSLLAIMVDLMDDKRLNMESALYQVMHLVKGLNASKLSIFPRMNVTSRARRNDGKMLIFL